MTTQHWQHVDRLAGRGLLTVAARQGDGEPVTYTLEISRRVTRWRDGREYKEDLWKVEGVLQTDRPYTRGIVLAEPHQLQLSDGKIVGGVMFEKSLGADNKYRIYCNDALDLMSKYRGNDG
jgi:hypothetical protein